MTKQQIEETWETVEEMNTDLDYMICEGSEITIDELDSISLDIVEEVREAVLQSL